MKERIEFKVSRATAGEILQHLSACDPNFVGSLRLRVDLQEYAVKVFNHAVRFEAWAEGKLVGLVAIYCNDQDYRIAYITNVSVLAQYQGRGIATQLIHRSVEHADKCQMRRVRLEVGNTNHFASSLYAKSGFVAAGRKNSMDIMDLILDEDRSVA